MKYLYLILACLVLLLSTRPCCTDDCSEEAPTVTKNSPQPASNNKDCAGCSPFACYCIGFIVSKPIRYISFTPEMALIKYTSAYQHPYIEDVAQAIWQPPKLS